MSLYYHAVLATLFVALSAFLFPAKPAEGTAPDSSEINLRIYEASADERPGYESVDIEFPDGTLRTFWVGDPVMTVTPDQVQELTVEEDHRSGRRITVRLDAEAGRQYRSVTQEAVGRHLAISLGGEFIMVPRVYDAIIGGRISLFNVSGDLLARFAKEVWERNNE